MQREKTAKLFVCLQKPGQIVDLSSIHYVLAPRFICAKSTTHGFNVRSSPGQVCEVAIFHLTAPEFRQNGPVTCPTVSPLSASGDIGQEQVMVCTGRGLTCAR